MPQHAQQSNPPIRSFHFTQWLAPEVISGAEARGDVSSYLLADKDFSAWVDKIKANSEEAFVGLEQDQEKSAWHLQGYIELIHQSRTRLKAIPEKWLIPSSELFKPPHVENAKWPPRNPAHRKYCLKELLKVQEDPDASQTLNPFHYALLDHSNVASALPPVQTHPKKSAKKTVTDQTALLCQEFKNPQKVIKILLDSEAPRQALTQFNNIVKLTSMLNQQDPQPPEPRVNLYFFGPTASGKSYQAHRIASGLTHNDLTGMYKPDLSKPGQVWFDGLNHPVLLMDDVRPRNTSFPFALQLMDRYRLTVPQKGSIIPFTCVVNIWTTPKDPRSFWNEPDCTNTSWAEKEALDQFYRRLHLVVYFGPASKAKLMTAMEPSCKISTEVTSSWTSLDSAGHVVSGTAPTFVPPVSTFGSTNQMEVSQEFSWTQQFDAAFASQDSQTQPLLEEEATQLAGQEPPPQYHGILHEALVKNSWEFQDLGTTQGECQFTYRVLKCDPWMATTPYGREILEKF